jgi:hypothetical protein
LSQLTTDHSLYEDLVAKRMQNLPPRSQFGLANVVLAKTVTATRRGPGRI